MEACVDRGAWRGGRPFAGGVGWGGSRPSLSLRQCSQAIFLLCSTEVVTWLSPAPRPLERAQMSAATKAAVAAMMKLPKQERIDRLVAMSTECISRQEDAAPFLALIQMELEAPDDPPATRPSSAAVADPARAKARSKRRELTAKRNELRAMLAKVDARERTMAPPSAASRAAYAAAAPAPHGAPRHIVWSAMASRTAPPSNNTAPSR